MHWPLQLMLPLIAQFGVGGLGPNAEVNNRLDDLSSINTRPSTLACQLCCRQSSGENKGPRPESRTVCLCKILVRKVSRDLGCRCDRPPLPHHLARDVGVADLASGELAAIKVLAHRGTGP